MTQTNILSWREYMTYLCDHCDKNYEPILITSHEDYCSFLPAILYVATTFYRIKKNEWCSWTTTVGGITKKDYMLHTLKGTKFVQSHFIKNMINQSPYDKDDRFISYITPVIHIVSDIHEAEQLVLLHLTSANSPQYNKTS